jgi:hypothetical protein
MSSGTSTQDTTIETPLVYWRAGNHLRVIGGNFYYMGVYDNHPPLNHLHVLKATDTSNLAMSWRSMDFDSLAGVVAPIIRNFFQSNEPIMWFDTVLIGSIIHVFYSDGVDDSLNHSQFDTSTDTWSQVETDSGYVMTRVRIIANNGSELGKGCVVAYEQNDGDIRVFWSDKENVSGQDYIRISMATFDVGTLTWGARSFVVNGGTQNNHDNIVQAFYDSANGRTHLITYHAPFGAFVDFDTMRAATEQWHVSVDDDGTVNTYADMYGAFSSPSHIIPNVGYPLISGGQMFIPFVDGDYHDSTAGIPADGNQNLNVAVATLAADPSFSIETITLTTVSRPESGLHGGQACSAAVLRGGNLEIWFSSGLWEGQTQDHLDASNLLMRIQRDGANSYSGETTVLAVYGTGWLGGTRFVPTSGIAGSQNHGWFALTPTHTQPAERLGLFTITDNIFINRSEQPHYMEISEDAGVVAEAANNYVFFE